MAIVAITNLLIVLLLRTMSLSTMGKGKAGGTRSSSGLLEGAMRLPELL